MDKPEKLSFYEIYDSINCLSLIWDSSVMRVEEGAALKGLIVLDCYVWMASFRLAANSKAGVNDM